MKTDKWSAIPVSTAVIFYMALLHSASLLGKTQLNVGVFDNPPVAFESPRNGKAQGLGVEPLEHVARSEGWELTYFFDSLASLKEKLSSGEVDIIIGLEFSRVRAEVMDFSRESILDTWAVIFRNSQYFAASLFDLENARIAIAVDDFHGIELEKMMRRFGLAYQVVPAASYEEALQFAETGWADVAVVSSSYSRYRAISTDAVSTMIYFNQSTLHYGYAKGRGLGEVRQKLDRSLEVQKKDPKSAYQSAVVRWTKTQVGGSEHPFALDWWVWVLIGATLPTLILGLQSFGKSRQATTQSAE